jgi:hypothetical protein
MAERSETPWRSIVPWIISAGLLAYVFGWATDWERLREATERADLPVFLLCASLDRLAFFVAWAWLAAAALRRFVADVPTSSVIAIRGGSELARVVSNPLSDAAFFLGIAQLSGGRLDAVVACALVPVVAHLFVLLVQMTVALPFLSGGVADNPSVVTATVVMWTVVCVCAGAVWLSQRGHLRIKGVDAVRSWFERFPPREIMRFLWGFAALALFDIQIQWFASRAFGVPIEWTALAARIPLVYLAFAVPTLGNFGTRELTWAALFSDFGERDALIAYAFAVNAIFLLLNLVLGLIFLRNALQLIGDVRRAHRDGRAVPRPFLKDPVDP